MVNVFIVGILLLSLLLIGLAVHFHRKNVVAVKPPICQKDNDCRTGERCIVDESNARMNVCAASNMKNCVFADFTKLTACDPANAASCKDCINKPEFACVVVSYGKPQLIATGRGYTSGTFRAALTDPATNQINTDRDMQVVVGVTDSVNGSVASLTITDPVQVYQKNDVFTILGGNNGATFRLTETPTPYFWQKGSKRINLPESTGAGGSGGWCLPPVDRDGIQCNPYTSDNVLVQSTDADGKPVYKWGCYCKMPSLMQHDDSPISNCGTLVGCAGYDLYLPARAGDTEQACVSNAECPTNSKCCTSEKCLKANETFPAGVGKCYTRWTNTTLDRNPRNGTCDCPPNTYFLNSTIGDYVVKTCNADACEPGGTKQAGTQLCNCKPGFVSCGVTPSASVKVTDARCSSTTTSNRCLPDPCAPGGTMRQGGGCNCDNSQGYYETDNASVIGGKVCTKLCTDSSTCGTRGTCTVVGGKEECKDCVCPFAPANASDKYCLLDTGKKRQGETCPYERKFECDDGPLSSSSCRWVKIPTAGSCCAPYNCTLPDPRCV